MKKIILFFVLCFILSMNPVFSEIKGKFTKVDGQGNVLEIVFYDDGKEITKKIFDSNGEVVEKGKLPDGLIKIYDQNDNLVSEYFIKNNLPNGLSKDFYKNGSVEYLGTYKNGKLEGLLKGYFESGKLKSETNYLNGKAHGIHKEYSEDGDLVLEENFKNDLKISSKIYEYYSKSKIKTSSVLILGKEGAPISVGLTKAFDMDGNIEEEIEGYDSNEEPHGKYKQYKNGVLIQEGTYIHGKQDGLWKQYWEETGFMAYKVMYKNGEKINQKAYNSSGQLLGEQNFQ